MAAGKGTPVPENISSKDKREIYLAHIEAGYSRQQSCEKAGVKYATVKYWRRTDDSFRQREEDINDQVVDRVEDALVAQLWESSSINDKLRYLEKARPEKWGQKSKVEHEHTLQFSGSVEDRLARVRSLMEAQGRDTAVLDAYVVADEPVAELPAASDS